MTIPVANDRELVLDLDHDLDVRQSTYDWSVRVFKVLKKILKVNVKLHHSEGQIRDGEIFLFNHFARFETFIPQYLIYTETGAMCRSVASSEFFIKDDSFTNFLLNAGAVPNSMPDLLPFLAAEILRGRKVIVFPEGGMVKDRRVVDLHGAYGVYSRKSQERRKHHTGAAVLALALDVFKQSVLTYHQAGHTRRLRDWAERLRLQDVDALLAAARRPTAIVPANITFYPIRVSDNLLRRGAELLSRGLSRRASEELMIEGNILLKHTDMDVRLGDPVRPSEYWGWFDKRLLKRLLPKVGYLDEIFDLRPASAKWDTRLWRWQMQRRVLRVRDEYMERIYSDVTVNLSHLGSRIILEMVDRGHTEVSQEVFHRTLYLAVKNVQRAPGVHLHRSLRNPEAYAGLLGLQCEGLEQFLRSTRSMELVERVDQSYRFLPKLREEHAFDEIRLENLVVVYANEVAPLHEVRRRVSSAIEEGSRLTPSQLAEFRFDDEQLSYGWDRFRFAKPRYATINEEQTATADPAPFLLRPAMSNGMGVVLVHGFLASPAELRGFGERLQRLGYTVVGVRLKGHGTSPWDLRERSWEDWLASVKRGYEIMAGLVPRIFLVGFSTGGALALCHAADRPDGLLGVAAVAVPVKFQNKNMIFVPLMHRANRLVRWVSSYEGVMPFRPTKTEHPGINYRHMPIRGLYELRRMVDAMRPKLGDVECPVLLLQGSDDPVVVPHSAKLIHDKLGAADKTLKMIRSDRHGILHEDIGDTQQTVVEFLSGIGEGPEANAGGEPRSLNPPTTGGRAEAGTSKLALRTSGEGRRGRTGG